MPILALVLILIALILFWQAAHQRKVSGLPGGRIIYTDTRQWGAVEKPLYDPVLNLTGKPDYLVMQSNGQIIPVEVKTGKSPAAPYDSHIYQLAVYCLLVERSMGKRPTHGILHYPGRTFAIDYTQTLEASLLDTLAEMRQQERRGEADCSHDQPARCVRCGYRSICDQHLA
jgi:CRISPR-associated exonuclease Cas4